MEQNPQHAITSIPNATTEPPPHDEPKPTQHRIRKRKHGAMHVLRVALFMMRGRSRKSKVPPVDDGSRSIWRKLVGSMRPLHLQSNQSPPPYPQPLQVGSLTPSSPSEYNTDGGGDDTITSASDFPAEECPYSPSPPSSRYASAVGLNELVQSDEDNEKQEEMMDVDGDEMIDAKAEEFIAQFYKQMRLQRLDHMDRHYRERSQRSLGW